MSSVGDIDGVAASQQHDHDDGNDQKQQEQLEMYDAAEQGDKTEEVSLDPEAVVERGEYTEAEAVMDEVVKAVDAIPASKEIPHTEAASQADVMETARKAEEGPAGQAEKSDAPVAEAAAGPATIDEASLDGKGEGKIKVEVGQEGDSGPDLENDIKQTGDVREDNRVSDQYGDGVDERGESVGYKGDPSQGEIEIPEVPDGVSDKIPDLTSVTPGEGGGEKVDADIPGYDQDEERAGLADAAAPGGDDTMGLGVVKTITGKIWGAITGETGDSGGGGSAGVRGTPDPEGGVDEEFDDTLGGMIPGILPDDTPDDLDDESLMQPVGEDDTKRERPPQLEFDRDSQVDPYAQYTGEETDIPSVIPEGEKDVDGNLIDPPEIVIGGEELRSSLSNLESRLSVSDQGKNDQAAAVLQEQALAAAGKEDFQNLAINAVKAQYGELPEMETEALSGIVAEKTANAIDSEIEKFEKELGTIGDDAQLANIDLQNMLQKQQQTIQMMSNISKVLHDTALAVIRKIG